MNLDIEIFQSFSCVPSVHLVDVAAACCPQLGIDALAHHVRGAVFLRSPVVESVGIWREKVRLS